MRYKYPHTLFNLVVEQIIDQAKLHHSIDLNLKLNSYYAKPLSAKVLHSSDNFLNLTLSTDRSDMYYPMVDEDYSFNSISISIRRAGVSKEPGTDLYTLGKDISEGIVTYDKINQGVRYAAISLLL